MVAQANGFQGEVVNEAPGINYVIDDSLARGNGFWSNFTNGTLLGQWRSDITGVAGIGRVVAQTIGNQNGTAAQRAQGHATVSNNSITIRSGWFAPGVIARAEGGRTLTNNQTFHDLR